MVKQYVGARYVPKFASPMEWAANTSYEALTIVTFNNASYTSKVPVPPTVGNPANNPQYWALTGNYNAQVEQYRQETETVSNNLTTEITNRKNADTTLQGKITTVSNNLTTLQGKITTVSNNLTTEITNRKNADTTLQGNINAEAAARQTADNTLQGNINSEAATRASADSNLQSQINQIIAPSGTAPSAAEVQNARIGADGVTYDTLGNAIRGQVTDLKSDLSEISENKENLYSVNLVQLGKNWTGGSASNRAVAYVPVRPNTAFLVVAPTNPNISSINVIEKSANTGASGNLRLTDVTSGTDAVITSTANTNYFCLQFVGTTTLSRSDFDNYDVYVCEGTTEIYSAVDKVARSKLESITEPSDTLIDFNDIQIGKNYTGSDALNRAVLYVAVDSSTTYYIENHSSGNIDSLYIAEKAQPTGASATINGFYVQHDDAQAFTTNAEAHYLCIQFNGQVTLTTDDFADYNLYLCKGDEPQLTAVDKVAREKSFDTFDTFYELAEAKAKALCRVGGYEFRNIVNNPKIINHWQDAHASAPYYDVGATTSEYSSINYNRSPKYENILNNLPQTEIDFTPQNNGFTRIVVGKNSEDLFFVAYVASNRLGAFGDAKYNALEVTSDFVNFRTILRSDALTSGDGIPVPNMTNLKVDQVKEFADGHYLVAIRCHNISENNDYTHFYRMASDFSEIAHCQYVDFNNNTVPMVDEFGGSVYDWSIFIAGNKGIATTYGNRNPETDYGRVWYTENSGYNWKQVFQTNNHLQEGQKEGVTVTMAHTHGVMIDIISAVVTRLFVLVGENNSNIFWTDKGLNATDSDWNVIDIRNQPFYNFQSFTQVVNGYPFKDGLIFGSDNEGVGCIYRLNKLDDGSYSRIESAHEFLPNKWNGTFYCAAEMSRRDFSSPLLMCETHENCRLTEKDNELLNQYHKARVVATYDGVNFTEIWSDDTYGTHDAYISGSIVQRKYSYCSRGMNCWLLKNGDAVIKYVGRDYYYFGGDPMFSVTGLSNGSCKVRWIKNAERYL